MSIVIIAPGGCNDQGQVFTEKRVDLDRISWMSDREIVTCLAIAAQHSRRDEYNLIVAAAHAAGAYFGPPDLEGRRCPISAVSVIELEEVE